MSLPVYLLTLLIFPCVSASSQIFGQIRNASVVGPSNAIGYEMKNIANCQQCLCNAFSNSSVKYFTCKSDQGTFVCQFYYTMLTRDQIIYSTYGTDIYLMKNETLEDDCCNTAYLLTKIAKAQPKSGFFTTQLRSILEIDSTTIAAIGGDKLWHFNRSDLKPIQNWSIPNLKSAGYHNGMYYLGEMSHTIRVYNASLHSTSFSISVGTDIIVIRFIGDKQMLVGAFKDGVYVYGKDSNGIFQQRTKDGPISVGPQLHAIGIVDNNTFYTGWAGDSNRLNLFSRDPNGLWVLNDTKSISFFNNKTSDIHLDQCGRIWSAVAEGDTLLIHHQNGSYLGQVKTIVSQLFNFLILGNNYELVMSHETTNSLSRIQPSLNCRQST